MRIVVAPSAFAGTLSSPQAAQAIAAGWRETAPADELRLIPISGGGPGLVDALAFSLDGTLVAAELTGPDGSTRVPAAFLLAGDRAWLEAAQVCGAAAAGRPAAPPVTSRGVGELIGHAVTAGARDVVVGLGGCVAADAGAGLLRGLAGASDADPDLGRTFAVARRRLDGVQLVAAGTGADPLPADIAGRPFADAVTALLGPDAPPEDVPEHPELHDLPSRPRRLPLAAARLARPLPDRAGAGDGGGLGFALLALGAHHRAAVDEVLAATGLAAAVADADLVLTGEGSFDHRSRTGSAVGGVAAAAERAGVACVVLAGRAMLGSRETRALGVGSAYAIEDLAGWGERGAEANLTLLAARAARTWRRR